MRPSGAVQVDVVPRAALPDPGYRPTDAPQSAVRCDQDPLTTQGETEIGACWDTRRFRRRGRPELRGMRMTFEAAVQSRMRVSNLRSSPSWLFVFCG